VEEVLSACLADEDARSGVDELGAVVAGGLAGVDRDGDVVAGGSDLADDVEEGGVVAISVDDDELCGEAGGLLARFVGRNGPADADEPLVVVDAPRERVPAPAAVGDDERADGVGRR
jgi:hypothetical protein